MLDFVNKNLQFIVCALKKVKARRYRANPKGKEEVIK